MREPEYDTMRRVEDTHWWYRVLRRLVVQALEKRLPEGGRILDAGCGTGGMLDALRSSPAARELAGFDWSASGVALTRARGFGQVVQGDVGAIPEADASCDAAVCLDVLCHGAVDEARAMRELHRVLRPGGWLVLNLPAWAWLAGEHDAAVGSARRYSPAMVRALFGGSGWAVESLHGWNAALLPAVWAVRWWSRRRLHRKGSAASSDLGILPAPVNGLLRAVADTDASCCRALGLPMGTSLFAVARKLDHGPR